MPSLIARLLQLMASATQWILDARGDGTPMSRLDGINASSSNGAKIDGGLRNAFLAWLLPPRHFLNF